MSSIVKEMAYADVHVKDINNAGDALPKFPILSSSTIDGIHRDSEKLSKRTDNIIAQLEKMNLEIKNNLK